MHRLKFIKMTLITYLLLSIFSLSCSSHNSLVCGNYYSQGEYIIERSNLDGWRHGHYLLTVDSLNTFELKEVSCNMGTLLTVCSGYLQRLGRNSYALKKVKVKYPYGTLGNPYYNNDNYRIIITNKNTIILRKGRWKTPLRLIEQDSIPTEFDFKRLGYDMHKN